MTKFKIIVGHSNFESARKYNGPRYVLPTRTFIKNGLIISLCFNHVSHREIREGGGGSYYLKKGYSIGRFGNHCSLLCMRTWEHGGFSMWANGCAHILVKYYLDNMRNFHQPKLIVQFTSIIMIVAHVIQIYMS